MKFGPTHNGYTLLHKKPPLEEDATHSVQITVMASGGRPATMMRAVQYSGAHTRELFAFIST